MIMHTSVRIFCLLCKVCSVLADITMHHLGAWNYMSGHKYCLRVLQFVNMFNFSTI